MPLEIYQRGATFWAKGRIEYNGRQISEYIRESTRATDAEGARNWIAEETERRVRRYLIGDEKALTFAEAVDLYPCNADTAKRLLPLLDALGNMLVSEITPKMVRDLGPQLYPAGCTDYWHRSIITPVRAVINNAHDLGRCPPIKIKGYSKQQRVAQDKARGKRSRIERTPGSWDWLLKFREHASPHHAALALFMFTTGARISQAVAMHPEKHLDLQNGRACVPGAKGHDDRWLDIPMELVVELANLKVKWPRGWDRKPANRRVFGFADRNGPRKGWSTACKKAGIEEIGFHAAGRHGFGQEFNVRQPIDEKAAGQFGGWSDTGLMRRTYTHAESATDKVHAAFRTGLVQAEIETGLKLMKKKA